MTRLRLTSFAFCLCLALLGATQLPLSRRVAAYGNQPAQDPQEPITASAPAVPLSPEQSAQREIIAQSPIRFEANRGQTDQAVKFIARGNDYTLFLTSDEMVIALSKRSDESDRRSFRGGLKPLGKKALAPTVTRDVVRMRLVKANAVTTLAMPEGLVELPTKSNYFIGDDPQHWQTDVPNYGRVRYHAVYPGIDLIYHGDQRQLEYDFVVAPEADSQQIRLAFDGGQAAYVDEQGDLIIETTVGKLRQPKPVIYQELNGVRQPVAGSYQFTNAREVGFAVAAYDHSRPLVIDPVLLFSTYLGGGGDDEVLGVASDSSNLYVCGITDSTNFPVKTPLQTDRADNSTDFFVTKLDRRTNQVLFSTYLGGSGEELDNYRLAADTTGIYLVGTTDSANYPTRNALQATLGGGTCGGAPCPDAAVSKLNLDGNALVYSTYLGGRSDDYSFGATLARGELYISGITSSTNFPTRNPLQTAKAGSYDGYVAKLNAAGSALVYSTYLGGRGDDQLSAVAVDQAGNAYVSGISDSADFPTKNPLQRAHAGETDAVAVKLNPAGSELLYATYFGGSDNDLNFENAVDASGNLYLGLTQEPF